MTDRELLQYAAKAAGYRLDADCDRLDQRDNGGGPMPWNPLEDDGDALRLAVKLQMELRITGDRCLVRVPNVTDWVDKYSHGDPMDATRLAITLVAAEVGKTMECPPYFGQASCSPCTLSWQS